MPNAALAEYITGTYNVSRPQGGTYVEGDWTPGTPTSFPIDASIQPLGGKDVQLLPQGFTVDGTRKLYTETFLQVGSNAAKSDTLTIGTETWRVISVQHFDGGDALLSHYKAIIAKVDPT